MISVELCRTVATIGVDKAVASSSDLSWKIGSPQVKTEREQFFKVLSVAVGDFYLK